MLPLSPSELVRSGGLAQVARTVTEKFLAGLESEGRSSPRGNPSFAGIGPETEPSRPVTLVVDSSGSMRYRGRQGVSKFEFAKRVAASLAFLAVAQRNPVGLVIHDTHIRKLFPPRATAKHLLGLLSDLEATQPAGETSLARAWYELAVRHLPPGGRVILISDALDNPAHLAWSFQALRKRNHEAMLLQVLAPEEADFPFTGATRFRDLEQPGKVIQVDASRFRLEYRANIESHSRALRRAASDQRIGYHLLQTDQPVDRALGAYLARRLKP